MKEQYIIADMEELAYEIASEINDSRPAIGELSRYQIAEIVEKVIKDNCKVYTDKKKKS